MLVFSYLSNRTGERGSDPDSLPHPVPVPASARDLYPLPLRLTDLVFSSASFCQAGCSYLSNRAGVRKVPPQSLLVSASARHTFPLPLRLPAWISLRFCFNRMVFTYLSNRTGEEGLDPCSPPHPGAGCGWGYLSFTAAAYRPGFLFSVFLTGWFVLPVKQSWSEEGSMFLSSPGASFRCG